MSERSERSTVDAEGAAQLGEKGLGAVEQREGGEAGQEQRRRRPPQVGGVGHAAGAWVGGRLKPDVELAS